MARREAIVVGLGFALAPLSCAGHLLPILPHTGAAEPPTDAPLEVTSRTSVAVDPMSVSGSSIRYGDVAPALLDAIATETRAFSRSHATPREFALSVELIEAQAEYARERFGVALVVRATLRRRAGNVFVGQTQTVCRESSLVAPSGAAPIVYRCMRRLGRTLEGWLEEVAPPPSIGKE